MWNWLSTTLGISPTLIAPPVSIDGLVDPIAVSIVPPSGVLKVKVFELSLNTTLVADPPIINDVACKLPSFLRFAILVASLLYAISLTLYAPAPVLIRACPGSLTGLPYASAAPKSPSASPRPLSMTFA